MNDEPPEVPEIVLESQKETAKPDTEKATSDDFEDSNMDTIELDLDEARSGNTSQLAESDHEDTLKGPEEEKEEGTRSYHIQVPNELQIDSSEPEPQTATTDAPQESPIAAIESLPPLPEGKELELEPLDSMTSFYIEYDLTQPPTPGQQSRRGSIAALQSCGGGGGGGMSQRGSVASFSRTFSISIPFSEEVTSSLPRLLSKTTLIHSSEENGEETIQRLVSSLHRKSIDRTQCVDHLFHLLVGGQFDMETKFVIEESANVDRLLTFLSHCDYDLQTEIWSVFLAVVKKSNRNLEACTRVGLISKVLDILASAPPLLADLLVQVLAALIAYSINVKQTKHLLRSLKSSDGKWPPNSLKLLGVLKELPQRDGADVFFSFPGKDQSGIILPPLKTIPYQQGWTFSTWLRMEPLNSVTFEKEQPILYSFRTSKGVGYSCHFTGNCLVVNVEKTKGKEQSRCIKAELVARKWHHVAIAHCYSRWGRSEIKCFIDGQLAETIELSWLVTSAIHWDRCSIGVSADGIPHSSFCGQMGAMYLFAEALTLQQANSLFCLGPAYQSTFKHDSETSLPDGYKKHLFDGHLHSSLIFAYCPKNCHGQLCLYTPAKNTPSHFVQIPHAVMKEGVEVVTTHSIHKSLQSVGGIQILLPLFSQIDMPPSNESAVDGDICQTLLSLISTLLTSSQSSQQQLFHSKGFLIISHCLQNASPSHLSMSVLDQLIAIAKFLLRIHVSTPLLKHLFEFILFNPKLWIRAASRVQVRLFHYLATDFLANNNFSQIIRRAPTVIEMCHTLKHFYFLVPPAIGSPYTVQNRNVNFATQDLICIRSSILTFVNRLIVTNAEDEAASRDQEIHTLFNLVATTHEDDNLYDILALVTRLLAEYPAILIPAFDKHRAISIVFNLLSSSNELIRIPALKILGYFLARSTIKRKQESMLAQNLFPLIGEKLLMHGKSLSLATYNALLEILVEQMTPTFTYTSHEPASPQWRFENPQMLKVMAHVIAQSDDTPENLPVRKCFLLDIVGLTKNGKDNRRTILQMSVWQDWLIGLAYIFPENEAQMEISELVWETFSILLHHALRHEYGGWRVWVDTLAIAHSKVSFEKYRKELKDAKTENGNSSKNEPTPVYRTPEFVWSDVHVRLLNDLLNGIESVLDEWKHMENSSINEQCGHQDNQVFVGNIVHVISQLSDSLIMACGGLLPLLAYATSPNSELEIVDACQQQLPIPVAAQFLTRFARLLDTFVLTSTVSFSELEQEKNMPSGGVLRQALRLSSMVAVRHVLAARVEFPAPNGTVFDKNASQRNLSIFEFVIGAIENKALDGIIDLDYLVQEIDIQRIKGVVYRDMVEENRQAQFLALSVIYLMSVLMVSRYRDILEPPTTPSPFFNSTNNSEGSSPSINGNGKVSRQSSYAHTNENGSTGVENGIDAVSTTSNNDDVTEAVVDEKKDEVSDDDAAAGISAIKVTNPEMKSDGAGYNEEQLKKIGGAARRESTSKQTYERREYLTNKLQKALETSAPLLREMMTDFRIYLQKTLLGTHGQEIMNDAKVLETLRNKSASVIELVMLLCSQEWQTSLQKHAGLAFIELVNEGRLMAHATRDHILRVANEADFILNRLRAEDVSKHSQFEAETAEQIDVRHDEHARFDLLIVSSKRRDALNAVKLLEKMTELLIVRNDDDDKNLFWRLDVWEDDSRRRKRFVPNPHGSRHEEARQKAPPPPVSEEKIVEDEEQRLRKILNGISAARLGSKTNELVDESDIDKWASEIDPTPSSQDACFSCSGKLIAPGVVVPGTVSVTATDLYFDADEDHPLYRKQDPKVLRYCESLHARWNLLEIRAIFLRRFQLQNVALELFLATRTAVMFAFNDEETVKKVVYQLPRVGVGVKYGLPQSRKTSLMTPRQLFRHSDMSSKWQKREISNFDYLMFLNTVAGRSFNDLSQYPVFPWILTNYTSDVLDLNVASNFRDLSKPIGALSEQRRKFFNERYTSWADDQIPPFHYGTHYSTPAFTLNWLMRVEPFATMYINLNDNKFDHADRLIHSIKEVWERCQRDSHDVKELIPEMFYLPEMFRNANQFDLGVRMDKTKLDDVELPPWADSPEHFVQMHRQALESDLVSCQLNQWIDLIFGYKQRGAEAVRATNVFYHLTYEGGVDLKSIDNPMQLEAIEEQIASFGQTPSQLLTEAHPPRHSVMSIAPNMFRRLEDDLCMIMKYISNSAVVYLAANTFHQLPNPTVISIAQNLVFSLNKWDNTYSYGGNQRSVLNPDNNTSESTPVHLPLTADPQLATSSTIQPIAKRHLGDSFDQRLVVTSKNFVSTTDSRFIFACGYPDYSFRIIDTETGKVRQAVYGHGDVVTCIARSETSLFSDCYVVTGSMDCTAVLWHWNGQQGMIAGEYNQPGETPTPRSILVGHDAQITALCVSAEHGLVISGCEDGVILMHTTGGDLLRRMKGNGPLNHLVMSRECVLFAAYATKRIVTYSSTARTLNELSTEENIECVTITRDGEFAVTGSSNGRVTIWRMFPLTKLYTYQALDSGVRSIAVSASHRFILGGLDSGAIVVFNADFNRWHYEYKHRYQQAK